MTFWAHPPRSSTSRRRSAKAPNLALLPRDGGRASVPAACWTERVRGRAGGAGHGCKIQNNVSLYDDVILEDDVFVAPSAVFTNVVNPRSFIERKHEYRTTRIGRGASVGANATVVCGHNIGEYAFVGAGAVVTKDVAPMPWSPGACAPNGLDVPLRGAPVRRKRRCPAVQGLWPALSRDLRGRRKSLQPETPGQAR